MGVGTLQKRTQKRSRREKQKVDASALIESILEEMACRRKIVGKKKYGMRFLKISLSELEQEAVCELIDYLNWSVLQVANVLVSRQLFKQTLLDLRGGLLDD